jgi:hypothetical protein
LLKIKKKKKNFESSFVFINIGPFFSLFLLQQINMYDEKKEAYCFFFNDSKLGAFQFYMELVFYLLTIGATGCLTFVVATYVDPKNTPPECILTSCNANFTPADVMCVGLGSGNFCIRSLSSDTKFLCTVIFVESNSSINVMLNLSSIEKYKKTIPCSLRDIDSSAYPAFNHKQELISDFVTWSLLLVVFLGANGGVLEWIKYLRNNISRRKEEKNQSDASKESIKQKNRQR